MVSTILFPQTETDGGGAATGRNNKTLRNTNVVVGRRVQEDPWLRTEPGLAKHDRRLIRLESNSPAAAIREEKRET